MDRRYFLKAAGLAGGGLVLSLTTLCTRKRDGDEAVEGEEEAIVSEFNNFLKIDSAGNVVFLLSKHEMGQGVSTSMAMILAEELCADWEKVRIEFAVADLDKYQNNEHGGMGTGGSLTMLIMWPILRKAGAVAKGLLTRAAAQAWGIPFEECYAENGYVLNRRNSDKRSFGELAATAATLTPDGEPTLKNQADHKLIGKPIAGKNLNKLVTGNQKYGIDMHIDGMLYAVIARTPVYNGKVATYDASAALQVKGVRQVVPMLGISGVKQNFLYDVRDGIAVLADTLWAAQQGRKALQIEWDFSSSHLKDLADFESETLARMNKPIPATDFRGNVEAMKNNAEDSRVISADYVYPYQLHMFMEPLNCLAHCREDQTEIWMGTQAPNFVINSVSENFEIPVEQVKVYTFPSGGGFGRRYFPDVALEAVHISRAAGNIPVKLLWTREDDFQVNHAHGYTLERYSAAISSKNQLQSWYFKELRTYTWGASKPYPKEISWIGYDIPNIRYDFDDLLKETLVQCVAWRAVIANAWAFGQECFLDEVAVAMGRDPYELRMELLASEKEVDIGHSRKLSGSRLRNVIKLAAEKAGWGKAIVDGKGMGIAAYPYMHGNAYCAMVAEVAVSGEKVIVERIVVAADCGKVINPSNARNQIEGGIMWGLSAFFHGGVDIEKGRVVNSNFHEQRFMRMEEAPQIETHFIESGEDPWGVGELSPPVVVPAVANAVFAATGKRIRRLPVSLELQTDL
jgi:isoquinoline 1-oxidoreductase subunit beta